MKSDFFASEGLFFRFRGIRKGFLRGYEVLEGLPNTRSGRRCVHLNLAMRHGMFKTNATRMKTYTAIGIAAGRSVFQVAAYGTTYGGQLAAYLMMTPSVKVYFQKVVALAVGNDAIVKDSTFGTRALAVIGIGTVACLVANDVMRQCSLWLWRHVLHDSPIGFLHVT